MLNLIKSLALVCTLLFVFSCGEDCETCTVSNVITVDGVETSNQVLVEATEYCDDELDAIKASATSVDLLGTVSENRVSCN